jgi:hydrogenase expression/formation protein HypE
MNERLAPLPACPLPDAGGETIVLAHGGGGRLMQQLLGERILPALGMDRPEGLHDAAVLALGSRRLAFTTDSYVVRPRFFPGGDIGQLAVNGTVNDLAMAGARPLWMSVALILEEGLSQGELERVLHSMRAAAEAAGVDIVTGDTKVVDRGAGDGLYINTAGLGVVEDGVDIHPARVQAQDAVLVSGDLGRHGMAVLACREQLDFDPPIESDCAALWPLVQRLLDGGVRPHVLRDITRGGLAAVLHEIAQAARAGIVIDDAQLPVDPAVASACELLGLDPMHLACEGRLVACVPQDQAERALDLLRAHPLGRGARRIGSVQRSDAGAVLLRTRTGAHRIVDLPGGELLPRIC